MTKLTDVLKRDLETAEKCHVCLNKLMIQGIESLGITATTLVYVEEQSTIIAT